MRRYIFILIALLTFLFSGIRTSYATCSESGTFIICEDWDSDTPPSDPWPTEGGESWHGWTPQDSCDGGCLDSDVSESIYNSGNRSMQFYRGDGYKSTVDMFYYTVPQPYKTKVYIRFYIYVPSSSMSNLMESPGVGGFVHLAFVTTFSSAQICLDLRNRTQSYLGYGNGEDGSGYEWFDHIMFAPHTYTPGELWVVENIEALGQPFDLADHADEWVLVEWMIDFTNKLTSLWVNETQQIDEYTFQWPASSFSGMSFSGFTLYTSGDAYFYIDDIAVAEDYIGPRGPIGIKGITID